MAIVAPASVSEWRPLGSRQTESRMLAHDVIGLHTMVGFLISTDRMWRPDGYAGLESHFGVGGKWGPDVGLNLDGKVLQWQDLAYQADANLDGNPYVISIETADNARAPIQGWTDKQVNAIVRLLNWLCSKEAHVQCPRSWACRISGIPRQLIPNTRPGVRGIGYHRQGITGNYPDRIVPGGVRWSNATGKTCPTDVRIAQIKHIIIPRLNMPEEALDMPYYTVYGAPKKPPRIYVDGAMVGFPNQTELTEYMAAFDRAGYVRHDVTFAEADDWQRYMDGHEARLKMINEGVKNANLRALSLQGFAERVEPLISETHEAVTPEPVDTGDIPG